MNAEESKQALNMAVVAWRKKHGVQDHDPMLAVVELWEIYFTHAKTEHDPGRLPSFEEFRDTMEQLERLSESFNSRSTELVEEMRVLPQIRSDLNRFPLFAMVFGAALAMLAGVLIGRFVL